MLRCVVLCCVEFGVACWLVIEETEGRKERKDVTYIMIISPIVFIFIFLPGFNKFVYCFTDYCR